MTRAQQEPIAFPEPDSLYRDIIERCADGVVVVDPDQRITYLNRSAEAMFGHCRKAVIGASLDILVPEALRGRHAGLVDAFHGADETARHMEARSASIQGLRADGTAFPADVSILRSGSNSGDRLVAIVRDITLQKKLEDDLRMLASTDSLTGILNRRTFLVRAAEEHARSERYGHPMAIGMIDIDHFKAVNDAFGHDVGDEAIRHLVEIAVAGLRKPDVLGRWGGEEFALILPDTTEEAAIETAERLRKSIEATPLRPNAAHSDPVPFTVSIGIAAHETGGETVEDLIRNADKALYRAKNTGRNRVCTASSL